MEPEVAALAREQSLGDVAEDLTRLAQRGHRLTPRSGEPLRGSSHLGGLPDLPRDAQWPRLSAPQPGAGQPMMFVAQIRLDDLVAPDPLPDSGLLSFFCAGVRQHSSEPVFFDEPGSGHVAYFESDAQLERASPPPELPAASVLAPVVLEARPELTLPRDAHLIAPLGLDPWSDQPGAVERAESYERLLERLLAEQGLLPTRGRVPPDHRLLGHATTIDYDVLDLAAFMALQRAGEEPSPEQSASEAGRWRLLLQVESDTETSRPPEPRMPAESGVMFGDGGILYFCIPSDDLASLRFDRVEAVVQSG